MPGCELGIDPAFTAPLIANGSGGATLSIPAILPAGLSTPLFAQAAHASTANPLGLATTNTSGVIVGNSGLSNYVYNWTVFSPTAQHGPFATNRGAVLLVR